MRTQLFWLCVCLCLFSRVLGVNNKLQSCAYVWCTPSWFPLSIAHTGSPFRTQHLQSTHGKRRGMWMWVGSCPWPTYTYLSPRKKRYHNDRNLTPKKSRTAYVLYCSTPSKRSGNGPPRFPSCACATFRWRTQYHSGPAYHPRSIWPVILRLFTPQHRFYKKNLTYLESDCWMTWKPNRLSITFNHGINGLLW
jgi:hypothetical protein